MLAYEIPVLGLHHVSFGSMGPAKNEDVSVEVKNMLIKKRLYARYVFATVKHIL